MPLDKYTDDAIERAKYDALEWLLVRKKGYPRSHNQEAKDDTRRAYTMYDGFEAPPIYGYEVLEKEGKVKRGETVIRSGRERIEFTLIED